MSRLLIGEAEPSHVDGNALLVGPSFANASDTTKLAFPNQLFSAFATAEFNTLRMIPAALFGVNVK